MKMKILFAALLTAFVTAFVPAGALAADPTAAVTADLAKLTSDVKTAHDGLLADVNAITADAGKGDKAAVKTDITKLRTDVGPLRADRKQLRTDLKAAKDAGVDPTTLKPLVKAARQQNQAVLQDVWQAAKAAHQALKSLRH